MFLHTNQKNPNVIVHFETCNHQKQYKFYTYEYTYTFFGIPKTQVVTLQRPTIVSCFQKVIQKKSNIFIIKKHPKKFKKLAQFSQKVIY